MTGKYDVRMLRGWYVVWEKDGDYSARKAPEPNQFRTYDEAKKRQYELNDWQCIGKFGNKVYKGDPTFNKAFEVKPWEHVVIIDDLLIFYIWDTREITKVAKKPDNVMPYLKEIDSDNSKALKLNGKTLTASELSKLPVTYKTRKQAAYEDFAEATSDNTSLAPDVDSVGSGDTQITIYMNTKELKQPKFQYTKKKTWQLYDNNTLIAEGPSKNDLAKQFGLEHKV
jgi:hypothetical protein